jgi:hypothetical protein
MIFYKVTQFVQQKAGENYAYQGLDEKEVVARYAIDRYLFVLLFFHSF